MGDLSTNTLPEPAAICDVRDLAERDTLLHTIHLAIASLALGQVLEVRAISLSTSDAVQEWCCHARYEFLGVVVNDHEIRCFLRKGGAVPRTGERPIIGEPTMATDFAWSARVRLAGDQQATVYTRTQAFSVNKQASFAEEDGHPSAVEYLLGALGGDLVNGFQWQAAKRGITLDALELAISGRLDNALVFVGVVGAQGHAGFESITATLYVSTDADESNVQDTWQATLTTSPLVNTLEHCVALSLRVQVIL